MTHSLLYSEINFFCILVLLLLSMRLKKSMFLQDQRFLLFLTMVANMALFALDACWIFVDNNVLQISVPLNWALNISYYILGGFMGYLWFLYSETVQKSRLITNRTYLGLASIPVVLLAVVVLASVKTGWMFYIDADNTYHRGPLYFFQIALSYGYVIVTALKAFCRSFSFTDYAKKREFRTLSMFAVPSLAAGAAQVLAPGFPLLCMGNTLGILYVFVTLQDQLVSVDALTKLNNRNQLFQFLSTKLTRPDAHKHLYLVMMDLDYFKKINDEYGHIEGDNALKNMASCLRNVAAGNHYFVSRYGGDEFIMVCELEEGMHIQDVCDAIHREMDKVETSYPFSASIGYAHYVPSMKTQQDLIAKADEELYKIKRARR